MLNSNRLEARTTKRGRRNPAAMPIREFFGKYFDAIVKGEAPPPQVPISLRELVRSRQADWYRCFSLKHSDPWCQLRDCWAIRLLRAAAAENDAEGCKRLLAYILPKLGVQLPKGVLIPFRWKVGRPVDTETLYAAWVERGSPETSWRVLDELAKGFYPEDFLAARSDDRLRKKLRDRIRNTIRRRRRSQIPATKSTLIS